MKENKEHTSGWYVKSSPAQEYAENKDSIDGWYDRIINDAYRGVSVEAPAKMICALGKLAQERGLSFQDLIEQILSDYLAKEGITWREE